MMGHMAQPTNKEMHDTTKRAFPQLTAYMSDVRARIDEPYSEHSTENAIC